MRKTLLPVGDDSRPAGAACEGFVMTQSQPRTLSAGKDLGLRVQGLGVQGR